MRILTGYMPATEGKAVVAGFDVFDQPIEAKRRTGYLPETPPLYPDMTVGEYLTFVAKIKGVAARPNGAHRVKTIMERTRIADMAKRALRQAVEGLQAARRPGPGAHSQPGRADSRRADRRPRSQADHRDAPADQGTRRRSHDHPQHAHPARGRADLPAGRHHQQGQRRRGRHARQPDRPAARLGNDVRAGRRRRAPTPRRRSAHVARRHPRRRSRIAATASSATRSRANTATTSAATWRAPS